MDRRGGEGGAGEVGESGWRRMGEEIVVILVLNL